MLKSFRDNPSRIAAFILAVLPSLLIPSLSNLSSSNASFPKKPKAIAVYQYSSTYSDLDYDEIAFKITEKKDVKVIADILDQTPVDRSKLGAIPNAYIYILYPKNVVIKAKVVGWKYILLNDEWDKLYPISNEAKDILKKNIQGKLEFP